MKKFRVIKTATVRRVYYVHADDEIAAIAKSVDQVPEDEDTITEEVVSASEWPGKRAATTGAEHG